MSLTLAPACHGYQWVYLARHTAGAISPFHHFTISPSLSSHICHLLHTDVPITIWFTKGMCKQLLFLLRQHKHLPCRLLVLLSQFADVVVPGLTSFLLHCTHKYTQPQTHTQTHTHIHRAQINILPTHA